MQKNNENSKNNGNKVLIWLKDIRNIFPILGTLFVIGIVVYGAIVATYRDLNSLEIVLLTVLGILVSVLVSYFFGQRVLQRTLQEEAKKGLEGEAKKALRRISVISQSAGRIFQNVQEKLSEFTGSSEAKTEKSNELIHEYFWGIGNQIKDLITNIKASIEDWRDILPEEFKKLDEQNKKLADAYERTIRERDAIERNYVKDFRKHKEDKAKRNALIRALRRKLTQTNEKYQAEIEKIRSESEPIPFGVGTSPYFSFFSGKRPSDLIESGKIFTVGGKPDWPVLVSSEKKDSELQELVLPLEEKPKKKPKKKSEE